MLPWRCWIVGHCWTLVLERGHMYLVCQRCALRTMGWNTAARLYLLKKH